MPPTDADTAVAEPDLPELPSGWWARVPRPSDLPVLVALRIADQQPWTGETTLDEAAVESEVVGLAAWTRRQLLAVREDDVPRAWITVHDRAAGRAMVAAYLDRTVPDVDALASPLYAWAERRAVEMARFRGIGSTRLDASPYAADVRQLGWLADAGYTRRRTWLHMSRPVTDADTAPVPLREGVSIRPVATHPNGVPAAADLRIVHRMLEESFQDHFNSYRESFPEFVQRLREDPGHRWDHWWLAYVDEAGQDVPAGALVSTVLAADASGREGSYVDYIGVNRAARGRGVAKGLLATVVADAAGRGRNRVGLEVDADSPTDADQLYVSLGWETEFLTESWFEDLEVTPA